MKTKLSFLITLLTLSLALAVGCKKDDNGTNGDPKIPVLSTTEVSEITQISVVSGGVITDDGGNTVTARGVCWSTTENPTINDNRTEDGTGAGSFTSSITDLEPNTTYYLRAYASNSAGTAYGQQVQFTTDTAVEPVVAAFTASPTSGTAPLTVDFTDQSSNNPTSWQWDFGDGNSSTQQNPSRTFQNSGDYTVQLTVSNEHGTDTETKTNYINVESGGGVGQPCPDIPSFTYDGQTYNTVLIGDQCWMAENLNYETGYSWCYDNDPANCATYGRLYHWQAALNACPDGWHLPSDEEWKILEGTVDSQYGVGHSEWNGTGYRGSDVGKKLKATTSWISNGNGTDDYGFGALSGGRRTFYGPFGSIGGSGGWWSSTEYSAAYAWFRNLYYDYDKANRSNDYKSSGFSVRCLKD